MTTTATANTTTTTTTTANSSSTTDAASSSFGWPVQVFRHTQTRGWEKAINNVIVYATPCVGGVEIRQFRVRIRVFPKETSTSTRCTKRRNLLFLSTRSQAGSIVFSFRSETACHEFFDELLDLNGRNVDENKKKKDTATAALTTEGAKLRRQHTLSYLARLLQDKDFGQFVQNVEDSLTSSEDGKKMLEAFQVTGCIGGEAKGNAGN